MDKAIQISGFYNENRLKIALLTLKKLLMANGPTWRKVLSLIKNKINKNEWETVNHRYDDILNSQRVDLRFVCILPQYRGKGYAKKLLNKFLFSLTLYGKRICQLSVDADNHGAVKLYESLGFELYRKCGVKSLIYIKLLTQL